MIKFHNIVFCVTILGMSACGGRVANPVAVEQALDKSFSCAHLSGEYDNHRKRLVELTGERKDKPMHNVGMLISSPLFLDLSQAQKEEAEAIVLRQSRLRELMANKNCANIPEKTTES